MNEPGFMPDGLGGRLPLLDCGGTGRKVRRMSLPLDEHFWDGGEVAFNARGHDVVVDVPGVDPGVAKPLRPLTVRMVGDGDGSVIVRGSGWINAVREGGGAGDAVRECGAPPSSGSAKRSGSGPGNAVVRGNSRAALALREGSGDGHALGLEPIWEGSCLAHRDGVGRGFALGETAVRFDDWEEALAELDHWLASLGSVPRTVALPGGLSRPVAALVEGTAGSVCASLRDFSAGDLASVGSAGGDEDLEWEQFGVMLDAVRELCEVVDVAEHSPLSSQSQVAERWRDFALSFAKGGSMEKEYGRLADATALQLGSRHPPEPESVNAQVEEIRGLADALVCLNAAAANDLLVASGYLREAAVRLDRVARLSGPACDVVIGALSVAADLGREREASSAFGR